MRSNTFSQRVTTILMLIAACVATAVIGAWQSISPSPSASAEQRSVFVQSGGVTTDVDPSLTDATPASSHARVPSHPEVAATTL